MTLMRDTDLAEAFDHAAPRYDRLVGLNAGYHADLRRSARRLRLPAGGAGRHILDIGCGTGASTAALLRAAPLARITAVDASAGMLERAAAKSWPADVRFVHSPVERLAAAGVTGPFDAVFAGYLFRNVADLDAVLAAVHALLRPGGRLAVHEYSLSGSAAHRALWSAVCGAVIIPAGTVTGDTGLYRYLRRSVLDFDTAPRFAARLAAAGFTGTRVLPVPGWQTGIVHTFLGRRAEGGAKEATL
ncbi:ubiquinone biosynthesis methyltransferase UbiE [Streptomyces agglomeratus]|uniref:Ubiquinone biosynthesis methyltransferase UbiE n=1 Tax=Streptomyces agglomeratus TaxID=285458 RepID=A0A1E5PGG9_9ACTN|nr:class I SAM-dependent methyltransferase [Streptomyces agglomeratus]OEJ28596.1 ubiquinone biosynthesis methyltransferase UbiE [Streptomyces agglomeratus]OEJ37339.1 ubiquinone biosynthesis methyltransferase UbiE [Streptomyces agglomeratus]OEJ48279.1 ubiquinone biosynthesis methyltransferase UbiE [Streptomyces agglomeratus]OEJ49882.1 ubiquinone biosynthesis methyltransferase UbiE [Streptomyces agglomeratus]